MQKPQNLQAEMIGAVAVERGCSADVLRYLRQVQKERRHLEWGYSSLFSLCRESLKYTEDEATIRIQAVRLIKYVPETEMALRKGKLSLTVASMLGRVIRREKLEADKAREVFERVDGNSKRETEATIAQMYPRKAKRERARVVNESEVELQITISKEDWAMAQELMDKRAHSNFERSPGKLFSQLLREAHKKLKEKQREDASPHGPDPVKGRRPSALLKRAVWARDKGKCQYPGCTETHGLQLDHIQPWAEGGPTSLENLRLLCGAHNRYRARTTSS